MKKEAASILYVSRSLEVSSNSQRSVGDAGSILLEIRCFELHKTYSRVRTVSTGFRTTSVVLSICYKIFSEDMFCMFVTAAGLKPSTSSQKI